MDNTKGVITVAAKHVEAGIQKYGGTIDAHLQGMIKAAGLQYVPYAFKDGRILLVLPNNLGGFLYESREVMFEALSLTS